MHERFLEAGIAVAGIDVGESYGSPDGRKLFSAFYDHVIATRSFSSKPCLLGRSRGSLWTSSWAIENPKKIAGIAGIYPAFDLRTYPGVARAAPAYGLTAEELENQLGVHNPIQRIDVLADARVPAFLIHGDQDTVIPLEDNSNAVVRSYKASGAEAFVQLQVVKGQGHNFWPGFFRCRDLVDFAITRARAGAPSR
jgi:alpha-beta hydrolase superfamily lysophospholipase